jgi:hypothetical protein
MYLRELKELIANMLTAYHSFIAKRSDWEDLLTLQNPAGAALRWICRQF